MTTPTSSTLLTAIRDLIAASYDLTIANLLVDPLVRVDQTGTALIVKLHDEGEERHEFELRAERIVDAAPVPIVNAEYVHAGRGWFLVAFYGVVQHDRSRTMVEVDLDTLDSLIEQSETAMRYVEADMGDGYEWRITRALLIEAQRGWIERNRAEARERYDLS
jgi:hypothetical protein